VIGRGSAIAGIGGDLAVLFVPHYAAGGSEKGGHFGGIVAMLPLTATTSGISPRSGPDDLLLGFSFEQELSYGQVAGLPAW
jgi:hypothetical protein